MPITSSMTAAARIVDPSRERSAPSSISVCAEMLTLVAVRIVPMKMPCQNSGRPKATASAAPPKNGQHDAAERPTRTRPCRRGASHEIGLETRDEHQQEDADLRQDRGPARAATATRPWRSDGAANIGHPRTLKTVGPSRTPTRISPKTAG